MNAMVKKTKKTVLDTDKLEGIKPERMPRKWSKKGISRGGVTSEPLTEAEKARFRILDESLLTAHLPVRYVHDGARWVAWSPVFPDIVIRHEDRWHVLEDLRVALLQHIAACAKRPT